MLTDGSATTATWGKELNCSAHVLKLALELKTLNVTVPVDKFPVGKLIVPPLPPTGIPIRVLDGCSLS